jgi:hypothetical protein
LIRIASALTIFNLFHFQTHGALRGITITFKPQTVMHR